MGIGSHEAACVRRAAGRRGLAMVMVLLVVAVAVVLGMAAVMTSTVRQSGTHNQALASRADYLAESGLQHGLWLLRREPESVPDREADALGPYYADDSDDGYRFYAVPTGEAGRYTIHGIGTCGGIERRASMTVQFTSEFDDDVRSLGPGTYWRLSDNDGTADDAVGSEHGTYHGVSRNRPSGVPHSNDGAAEFDGHNDYIDLGGLDIEGDEVTFLAWFKADDWDRDDARIVSKATGTARRDHYWMLSTKQRSGETRLRFRLDADGGTKELIAHTGDCKAGEWVFAAAVYDGERMRLYQNGVEVGSRRQSGDIETDDDVDAWIGGNPDGARSRPWDGCIDEVAIFERALSPSQIRNLWDARLPEVEILSYGDD